MKKKPECGPPFLRLCALASGSQGNAVYVSDGRTSLLLDAGLSGVEMERRLGLRKIDPCSLSAIVVSHEHADHVKGVGVFSRRWKVPVYATDGTWQAFRDFTGKLHGHECFVSGRGFGVGTLRLHPFQVSHDAADPVGFTVSADGVKAGVATDLGVATAAVREHLKGCAAILLESNHDVRMLEEGPYPWPVKQRVKGRQGHLSNEAARDLLAEVISASLLHVILGHLSETNNLPELAQRVVSQAISGHPARLSVASQYAPSAMLMVSNPEE